MGTENKIKVEDKIETTFSIATSRRKARIYEALANHYNKSRNKLINEILDIHLNKRETKSIIKKLKI